MKTEKKIKTTISVRLTNGEHEVLSRLCALKKTSRREYLSTLAKNQLKKELLRYASNDDTSVAFIFMPRERLLSGRSSGN